MKFDLKDMITTPDERKAEVGADGAGCYVQNFQWSIVSYLRAVDQQLLKQVQRDGDFALIAQNDIALSVWEKAMEFLKEKGFDVIEYNQPANALVEIVPGDEPDQVGYLKRMLRNPAQQRVARVGWKSLPAKKEEPTNVQNP